MFSAFSFCSRLAGYNYMYDYTLKLVPSCLELVYYKV